MVRSIKKIRKISLWLLGAAVLVFSQLGVLYQLDQFLKPPSLQRTMASARSAAGVEEDNKVSVPEDAVQYAIAPNTSRIAYVTRDNEKKLTIKDNKETDSLEETGNITFMKWLGQSNALLYMVEKRHMLVMNLLQVHHGEPVPIHEFPDNNWKVEDVFFSPYLEFFYVHMKKEDRDEVYKYTASKGLEKVPLRNMQISAITYDEKNDILYIQNKKGRMWEYKDGKLRHLALGEHSLS
ncbi:hypothetical protein [Aneurinibacillus tyrosinisolvens]|uniref:hypothetical protein n=1 Tax=Aneurinibacillus tyrosinisolvens TaxID=1443435 RepID=UPI00063F7120|nr:hypothetical protein [Aneurinibacillus tyrosinisolvens]